MTVEPMLRFPDYMAFRFNLRISHVYKGILLGTGPLVDPGFQGKLSIPLHNLTANDYTFKGGDGIIWMEFTKLSPNDDWHKDLIRNDRLGVYKGFPAEKNQLEDVENYLEKAVGRETRIRSSIPDVIQTAQMSAVAAATSAKEAATQVQSIIGKIRTAGIISAIAVVVAILLPLYYGFVQVDSLINDSHAYVSEARKEIDVLSRKFDGAILSDKEFDSRLDELGSQLEGIINRSSDQKLKSELGQIRSQLLDLKDRAKP